MYIVNKFSFVFLLIQVSSFKIHSSSSAFAGLKMEHGLLKRFNIFLIYNFTKCVAVYCFKSLPFYLILKLRQIHNIKECCFFNRILSRMVARNFIGSNIRMFFHLFCMKFFGNIGVSSG